MRTRAGGRQRICARLVLEQRMVVEIEDGADGEAVGADGFAGAAVAARVGVGTDRVGAGR